MSRLSALVDIIAAKPILRRKDLCRRYGVVMATVEGWIKAGVLPRPRYFPGCPFPFWTPGELELNERTNPKLYHDGRRLSWRAKLKAHHAPKKTQPAKPVKKTITPPALKLCKGK
jgi:hypothetical protein